MSDLESCATPYPRKRLSNVIGLLMFLGLANAALGLLNNIALASIFGASAQKDALEAALAIPRQIVMTFGLASFGGASLYVIGRLSAANPGRMRQFLSTIFLIQLVCSLFFALALWLFSEPIVRLMSPGMQPQARRIAINALSWTAWIVVLQPIVILLGASATGLEKYWTIPTGNMLARLGILGGALCVPVLGAIAYPMGAVIGLAIAVVLLGLALMRQGLRPTFHLAFRAVEIWEAFKQSMPWIVSAPVLNLATWILIPLMIAQGPGAYSSYMYAYALMTMVNMILVTPISNAFAPRLAQCAGRVRSSGSSGDIREEQLLVNRGFRISLIVGTGLGIFLTVGARPIVCMILRHGAMGDFAARRAAILLSIMGCSLLGQSVNTFGSRFFQARIAVWNLVLVNLASPLVVLGVALFLIKAMGINAVAVARLVSSLSSGLVTYFLSRHLIGARAFQVGWKMGLWTIGMVIVSAPSFIYGVPIHATLLTHTIALSSIGLVLVISGLLLGRLLKVPEIDLIAQLLLNRTYYRFFAKSVSG